MTMLRIGLIGAGRIGQVHAQSIATLVGNATLGRVADVNGAAARALGERYGVPHGTDYQDILNDPSIDAVAICSSTDTHAAIITEAARAGKPIFCEKPIDHDLGRIDAALDAVERTGVPLMIGFQRRFDPSFRRAKELIDAGAIGRPHLLRITSRDPAPPPIDYIKVSGGIFLDMTIHDFDMARFLFGEVDSVHAAGAVLVDPAIGAAGDMDTAVVTLTFANGAIGAIDNSRRAVYGYDQRVEALGDRGMVQVGNERPTTTVVSDETGVVGEKPLYFFLERYLDAYAAELQAFADAVVNDAPMPINGADGRAPVVIALAALASVRTGGPVKVADVVRPV